MAKIMVFQHVPYEPLGTFDPLIRERRHRIRYVNFARSEFGEVSLAGYDALIILGGPMNIGQEKQYPHLEVEKEAVREAMQRDIPVFGICLGSQIIASAAGAQVKPAPLDEIGWYPLNPTELAMSDPCFRQSQVQEHLFQWHSYTFDLPESAARLMTGENCVNQAYVIQEKIYGIQFHLEVVPPLIQRWLSLPQHQSELSRIGQASNESAEQVRQRIEQATQRRVERSVALSQSVFGSFLDLLPGVRARYHFRHR